MQATAITGVSSCAVGVDPRVADARVVYVGQRGKGAPPIIVLGPDGRMLRSFGAGLVETMHGMHMQQDDKAGQMFLWVTDSHAGKVMKFEPMTGKLLVTLGSHGTGISPIQFGSVADIAFDADGSLYISDGDGGANARIMKLDSSFKVVWVVGNNGTVAPAAAPF
eukprot:COSAG02_NODE_18383_length_942_cov_1.027284_1_plen_164_part_10